MNEIGGDWRKIKRVKMNYRVDEPTEMGNIYKKSELIKAFDKALENHPNDVPVVRNSFELYVKENRDDGDVIYKPIVKIKDIIGTFKGYEIEDNGEIFIEVKPVINTELFDLCLISTGVTGMVREDNTVDICSLAGFFLAGSRSIVEPERKRSYSVVFSS